VEVYRTADVPAPSRAAYWNEVYTNRFAPAAVDRRHSAFDAELRVGSLGATDFACVRSQPTTAERSLEQARRIDQRMLGFVMVLKGAGAVRHCDHEVALGAGEMVLSDNTQPMSVRFDTPMEAITVRAPEASVRARLPGFELVRGRALPGGGLAETCIALARSLSERLDDALPPAAAERASGCLLDIIAAAYGSAYPVGPSEGAIRAARRARVRAFIEGHLRDPELSPCRVADSLGISPRYLRKLLGDQGECASSLILRRRLEECARELSADVRPKRSITDIAFSWGFNSTAHFARVFKSKYGVSPREFRAPKAASAA
jgi:AraC-like DNA-binding protein